jgi:hypothetical protein
VKRKRLASRTDCHQLGGLKIDSFTEGPWETGFAEDKNADAAAVRSACGTGAPNTFVCGPIESRASISCFTLRFAAKRRRRHVSSWHVKTSNVVLQITQITRTKDYDISPPTAHGNHLINNG